MAAGSWLGLPEFGLSEILGGKTGSLGGTGYGNGYGSLYSGAITANINANDPTLNKNSALGASFTNSLNGTKDEPMGETLGASTTGSTGSGGGSDAIRALIEKQYSDLNNYYSNASGSIKGKESGAKDYVNSQYQNQLNLLNQYNKASQDKLGYAKNQVNTNKANSISELGNNLRQMVQATGMQLGAMGAGDSSASQIMAPYAYSKLANQSRGDILKQTNEQYNDINLKAVDLQNEYMTQKSSLDQWKASKINELKNYYEDLRGRLEEAKANASSEKSGQLIQLEQALLDKVQSTARQIDSQANSYNEQLAQAAAQKFNALMGIGQNMITNAIYNPADINNRNLTSMSTSYNPTNMDSGMNPYSVFGQTKKKSPYDTNLA